MDVQRYLADEPVRRARRRRAIGCGSSCGGTRGRCWRRAWSCCALDRPASSARPGAGAGGRGPAEAESEQRQRAEANEQRPTPRGRAEKAAKETAAGAEAETKAVLGFVQEQGLRRRPAEGPGRAAWATTSSSAEAVEAALPFVETSFARPAAHRSPAADDARASFSYLGDAKTAAEQFEAARALYTQPPRPRPPRHAREHEQPGQQLRRPRPARRRPQAPRGDAGAQKAKLGPDHPDTLRSMNNLANSYDALGRHADALKLREETLALLKAKLGPDHPDTLCSMNNLAMQLRRPRPARRRPQAPRGDAGAAEGQARPRPPRHAREP